MSWRVLSESDLLTAISPDELAVLRRALGGEASDIVQTVLDNLAEEIRGHISASGADLESTAATIPESLVARAVQIAVMRVSIRAGGVLPDPKGHRKDAHDAALKFLEDRVATGKFGIDEPTTPSSTARSGRPANPVYTAKDLTLERADQEGI